MLRRDAMSEEKVFTNEEQYQAGKALTQPSKRLKVLLIEDVPLELDRRTFLQGLGFAVLAVHSLALIGCESSDPPLDEKKRNNNFVMQSSAGAFGHIHDLLIPSALLQTPPREGVKLLSSKAFFHRHEIVLTQEDLNTVNQGGTVNRKASSHLFVIALVK